MASIHRIEPWRASLGFVLTKPLPVSASARLRKGGFRVQSCLSSPKCPNIKAHSYRQCTSVLRLGCRCRRTIPD